MGYEGLWVLRGMLQPTNEFWWMDQLWVMRGYGLSELWVKRGPTVLELMKSSRGTGFWFTPPPESGFL